jgi:hypothetical protein
MHLLSIILGAAAFISLMLDPLLGNLIFGLWVISGFGWMILLEKRLDLSKEAINEPG